MIRLDDSNLPAYLERAGVLPGADRVQSVGEGNLNFVRRVRCRDGASVVVKQARSGIEGLPEFPLSSRRILFERRYERTVRSLAPESASAIPRVLLFDEAARILVMEDVGDGPSLLELLRAGLVPADAIRRLGAFLGEVHSATSSHASALRPLFGNDEMRRLHGEQIFASPRAAPALKGSLADEVDEALAGSGVVQQLAELRQSYYHCSDVLVHGDVKSANVLLDGDRPRLIDAEFAHVGDPAFDLGTALAHLFLCLAGDVRTEACEMAESALLEGYLDRSCGLDDCGAIVARARHYAGADTIYHVLGPARLPFFGTGDRAAATVRRGIQMLCS